MNDKFTIAKDLRELGLLLSFKGENQFKTKAYFKGADSLEAIDEELADLVSENRLTEISGIGKAIAAKITELFQTGKLASLETLRSEFPPGVIELGRVPGLGLEKAMVLRRELDLTSVADLKAACLKGLVAQVSGFGAKTEEKILAGIKALEKRRQFMLLPKALETAQSWSEYLLKLPGVHAAESVGDLRRWLEVISKIEILVAAQSPQEVVSALKTSRRCKEISESEESGFFTVEARGFEDEELQFWFTSENAFPYALFRLTGTSSHIERIETLAKEKRVQIDEDLSEQADFQSDRIVYERLNLAFVPPEMRNGLDEFSELDRSGDFSDLVTIGDIKGMTHCHSTFSDGVNSIEEMAREAESMGMKYMTLTDHSPTASYAGGLTLDRLKQQWEEIERVQQKVKIKLLRGTESDILADGSLDYPDEILAQFDVIIASVHSRMKMDEEDMTRRIINCMRKRRFKIWGHALGRLLLEREPFKCRVEDVLDVIKESNAAIEINGDPRRLDMAPEWLREARKRNIRFVISTDAHSTGNLHNLRYGIQMARRAGIRRSEVLNAHPLKDFQHMVKP